MKSDVYDDIPQMFPLRPFQFNQTKKFYENNQSSYPVYNIKAGLKVDYNFINYEGRIIFFFQILFLFIELNVPLYSAIAFYLYLESIKAFPISYNDFDQKDLIDRIAPEPLIEFETGIHDEHKQFGLS